MIGLLQIDCNPITNIEKLAECNESSPSKQKEPTPEIFTSKDYDSAVQVRILYHGVHNIIWHCLEQFVVFLRKLKPLLVLLTGKW